MSGWRIVDARSIVGRRSLRDLHDLKLAANDRGSGGLTLCPSLSATTSIPKYSSRSFSFHTVYPSSLCSPLTWTVLSQVNRNRYQHHRRFYQYQETNEDPFAERRCTKNGDGGGERQRETEREFRMDEGAFFGSTRSNVDF